MFGDKICNVIDSILICDPNFFLVTIMRTDLQKNKWTLDFLKKLCTMLQKLSKCEVLGLTLFKFDHFTATLNLCEITFWGIQTVPNC